MKTSHYISPLDAISGSVEPRISAAAAAALFFSSEAETPDSDAECEQPEELWREMVQNFTVGVLSAFLGDMV